MLRYNANLIRQDKIVKTISMPPVIGFEIDRMTQMAVQIFQAKHPGIKLYRTDKVEFIELNPATGALGAKTKHPPKLGGPNIVGTSEPVGDLREPGTPARTDYSQKKVYKATENGLLTDAGGFQREAWATSTKITQFERMILVALTKVKGPITCKALAEGLNVSINRINGANSVMIPKGVIVTEATKEGRVVQITEKGRSLL